MFITNIPSLLVCDSYFGGPISFHKLFLKAYLLKKNPPALFQIVSLRLSGQGRERKHLNCDLQHCAVQWQSAKLQIFSFQHRLSDAWGDLQLKKEL